MTKRESCEKNTFLRFRNSETSCDRTASASAGNKGLDVCQVIDI